MTTRDDLQPTVTLPRSACEPDGEAVRCADESLTWTELEQRSRRFAQGLHSEGIGSDGAWAVLARNRLEWAEMTIGNGRAGSRYVPLNWHLAVPELVDLLIDSGSTLLIVDTELVDAGGEAAQKAGLDRVIVLGEDYEQWLSTQSDASTPDGPLGQPLQYTGGTTGRSKGVVRSQSGETSSALAAGYSRWGELTGMPENTNMMLCTPAYHALGGAVLRSALARGNRVDIIDRWDPDRILSTIEDRKIAGTAMVPTQFIRLLKLDEAHRARFDVSTLEWVLHTAAPCPAWVKQEMIEWFGEVIVELYGSSEGVGPVIATSSEWLAHPGTVGKATSALTISIVDDAGEDLPVGEVGTIYARRVDGSPEYFGDPGKTADMMLSDGRFTVGDVGWLDADGYLYLADRRVDLIIVGGSNIYPAEVEAVLVQYRDVADVAVFGVPDPEWGQQVKAIVEPVEGAAIDVDELMAFAAERIARFKLPASIEVVDSLPRESSGKLKKHLLRSPYWEESIADSTPGAVLSKEE